ncbi:MAG: 4'-phosphopantetheinyl transferase superfamily protein [Pseudomonadota bacterium]
MVSLPDVYLPVDRLFPDFVSTALLENFESADELWPDELPHIANAARKRRLDFRAGRHCARAALSKAGCPPVPIGRGAGREPLWPAGFVGAISHARIVAGAAVARTEHTAGLGLDIEARDTCDLALWQRLGTPAERTAAEAQVSAQDALLLTFSAKEAFYKAQYTRSGQWLGLRGAEVALDGNGARFEITLLQAVPEVGPAGARFEGRYLISGDVICTGICLPPVHPDGLAAARA